MNRQRWGIRVVGALLIAAGLLVPDGTRAAGDAARPGAGVAGHYLISLVASCTPAVAKSKVCHVLLGPFSSRVATYYATCTAQGQCRFTGAFAWVEQAAGGKVLCNAGIAAKPFNGTCRGTSQGSLTFKKGVTGAADVWVVAETTTFFATPTIRNVASPFGTNIDTGIPAAPGYYRATRYARLLGTTAARGITVQILVARV